MPIRDGEEALRDMITGQNAVAALSMSTMATYTPERFTGRQSTATLLGAQFQTENLIGSALFNKPFVAARRRARARVGATIDAGEFKPYSAFLDPQEIQGYEAWWEQFAESTSPEETVAIKRELDARLENLGIIESAPFAARFTAGMVAAMASPEILLPVGNAIKLARGAKTLGFFGSALETAAVGATGAAVSEIPLAIMDPTRTAEQSLFNVAGGTVLAGLFGSIGAALPSARRQRALERLLNGDAEVGADLAGKMAEVLPAMDDFAKFSPADQKRLFMEAAISLSKDYGALLAPGGWWGRHFKKSFGAGPQGRLVAQPESETARLLGWELSETAFLRKDPSQFTGQSAESDVVMGYLVESYTNLQMTNEFSLYRQAGGTELPTLPDFGEAITKANRRGQKATDIQLENGTRITEKRAIESVERAARMSRFFFDTWQDQILASGLMSKIDLKGTAESWIHRMWDRDQVAARRTELRDEIVKPALITRGMPPVKAGDLAEKMVFNLENAPQGRLEFELASDAVGEAGTFKERMIPVEDIAIESFLENDIFRVMKRVARTVIPDVVLARKFAPEVSNRIGQLINRVGRARELAESGSTFELEQLWRRVQDLQETQPRGRKIEQAPAAKAGRIEATMLRRELLERRVQKLDRELDSFESIPGLKDSQRVRDTRSKLNTDLGAAKGELAVVMAYRKKTLKLAPFKKLRVDNPGEASDFVETQVSALRRTQAREGVSLRPWIEKVQREFNREKAKAEKAGNPTLAVAIEKKKQRRVQDIEKMRDRLRNTSAMSNQPENFFHVASRNMRNINFIRFMGGLLRFSAPDVSMPIFQWGMEPNLKMLFSYMKSPLDDISRFILPRKLGGKPEDLLKRYQDAEIMTNLAVAGELAGNAQRIFDLGDIMDGATSHGRFSKFTEGSAKLFGSLTYIDRWNAFWKGWASVVGGDQVLKLSALWVRDGARFPIKLQRRLGVLGIRLEEAKALVRMSRKHGQTIDGLRLGRSQLWVDTAEEVGIQRVYHRAVSTWIRNTIITPSVGGVPLTFDSALGQTVFQFKKFAVEATNKIMLSGLQRHDMAVLQGMVFGTAMGFFVYWMSLAQRGVELPREEDGSPNMAEWIINAVDRSGQPGILFEVNNALERFSAGRLGLNPAFGGEVTSRVSSRNAIGSVLGPSFGTLEDIRKLSGAVLSGEFTAKDLKRSFSFVPGESLVYLRDLFRVGREALAEKLELE